MMRKNRKKKTTRTVALYKLNNIWIKGKKLKTSTKIKLYKSLVKSIPLFNWQHGHLP